MQRNNEREKEDLKNANEESEARLNMEIRSLKENLVSSRNEVENGKLKVNELHYDITNMKKEREDLRGDIAGIILYSYQRSRFSIRVSSHTRLLAYSCIDTWIVSMSLQVVVFWQRSFTKML